MTRGITADSQTAGNIKIAFRLERDEEGYPPADWEHLWARPAGGGHFALDNTPFFARGVSFGDVVRAEIREGRLEFAGIVRRSGHQTIRVILFRKELAAALRAQLRGIDCMSEQSHIPGLIAVDIPPAVPLEVVTELLAGGEERGDWEYEEASIG